jgi:predicted DNA-binding transcriptional regulator YafY
MKIHRLLTMLLLLESRGTIKARELAVILEVSPRTVYRDADVLAESGIPVRAATGPDGGISLMEGYTAGFGSLRGDDLVNLFLGGMGIPPGADVDTVHRLTETLEILKRSVPAGYRGDLEKAESLFHFDPEPWWHPRPVLTGFDRIRQALWNSRAIEVVYRKHDGSESRRVLHPLGLVVKQMSWYLAAWCESRGEIRVFRCERFTSVSPPGEPFERPEGFDLAGFWKRHNETFREKDN